MVYVNCLGLLWHKLQQLYFKNDAKLFPSPNCTSETYRIVYIVLIAIWIANNNRNRLLTESGNQTVQYFTA